MLRQIGPTVPYFHATDFFPGAGMFSGVSKAEREKIARTLPTLLDEHIHQVVAASFKEDEFLRIAPPQWQRRFGSLHGVAVQRCAGGIGHWANESHYYGPITYVLEAGDDDESDADRAFKAIGRVQMLRKHTRYMSHLFTQKGRARGLEAADYFAWHWNKFDAETLSRPVRPLRQDFRALITDHRKYRVFAFTGQRLEEFLSSMWKRPRLVHSA